MFIGIPFRDHAVSRVSTAPPPLAPPLADAEKSVWLGLGGAPTKLTVRGEAVAANSNLAQIVPLLWYPTVSETSESSQVPLNETKSGRHA
jgi:hypothetical protein